jgi:hypothetical protein
MLRPADKKWTAVVLGGWNRSILTPAGISRLLFDLPPETELTIEVPMNAHAPPRVSHEGRAVIASDDRIVVEATENTFASLVAAMVVARRAVDGLPLTPLIAAGFNVHYQADADIEPLTRLFSVEWDRRIPNEVRSRAAGRGVAWNGGEINMSALQRPDRTFEVGLNFNMTSTSSAALSAWLGTAEGDIRNQAESMIRSIGPGLL